VNKHNRLKISKLLISCQQVLLKPNLDPSIFEHTWIQSYENIVKSDKTVERKLMESEKILKNSTVYQSVSAIYKAEVEKVYQQRTQAIMNEHCFTSGGADVNSATYAATLPPQIKSILNQPSTNPQFVRGARIDVRKVNWYRHYTATISTPIGKFCMSCTITHPYRQIMVNGRGECVGG
jgi:hypothetical protein